MQKFAIIFLAAFAALLGLVVPVEGVALVDRETNAERFARGLPPPPPHKREGAPKYSIFLKMNLTADGGTM